MSSDVKDLDDVAAAVHQEWLDEMREAGVTSCLTPTGELMVPYDLLPEDAKEKARAAVRTAQATAAGLTLVLVSVLGLFVALEVWSNIVDASEWVKVPVALVGLFVALAVWSFLGPVAGRAIRPR